MSGFSVAACTVAIADRLHNLIGDAVPGARVTTLNPGSDALRTGDPFVNLYLFRTVRNPYVSNNDLPTRGPLGGAQASPVLKLDLDYMISFFGDDAKLDPQRLLGLVVGGLNAYPYIPREMVRAAIATTPWLGGTGDGAAEAPRDEILVTPMSLAPDAMARLWSEFVDVPYQLTQLYTATPIAIEVPLPVQPVLPVRRIGLRALPSRSLAILGLVNAADPDLPLAGGGTLAVRAADPRQPGLGVLLNGIAATGVTVGVDGGGWPALLVPLTTAQPAPLAAGPLTVTLVRTGADGGIAAQSPARSTHIIPGLASAPALSADGKAAVVTLALPVPVEAAAAMLLFPRGQAGRSWRIDCLPRATPGVTLTAPLAGVAPGAYLLSVEIDGVASLLDWGEQGYSGPILTIGGG